MRCLAFDFFEKKKKEEKGKVFFTRSFDKLGINRVKCVFFFLFIDKKNHRFNNRRSIHAIWKFWENNGIKNIQVSKHRIRRQG